MWEDIEFNSYCRSQRLRVPNGWVVRSLFGLRKENDNTCYMSERSGVSVHQIFVEDARNTWKLKKGE